MTKDDRLYDLVETLRACGSAAVAFSGGADSSLVAHAAHEALGERALAVHISSPTVPGKDSLDARSIAEQIGIKMITLDVDLMNDPAFLDNPPDRCGTCKKRLMSEIIAHARKNDLAAVVDGAVPDDLKDMRPGHEAADRLGVGHPLIEAGITKEEVHEILEELGLSTAGKPPSPCLASRIPYGQAITPYKLKKVDLMECRIREQGFGVVRVRLHETTSGDLIGIIELDDVQHALNIWDRIENIDPDVRAYLDPRGYRMGSMNEILPSP